MQVEEETLYEVWEEEILTPKPPSKLYNLEPIGIGTPLIESLTSYVSRLANAHSVLLRTLVTDEILPNLNRTHLYHEGQPVYDHLTTFWKQSAVLNGTCSTASNWVQTVEQLTQRNDLRFLTMITFANALSCRGLMRRTQAWCPICYEEWRKVEHTLYQPLLWQLSVVTICSQHCTLLVQHCPYCERTLPLLAPHFQPGYCTHCEHWLGNSRHSEDYQQISSDVQEWQNLVEQAVGELLAAAPSLPSVPCQEVISTLLSMHVHRTMEGNFSEFARRLRFHRRTVWEWTQGLQVPQLDALLQICSYFGTTLVYLLTGNIQNVEYAQQHSSGKKPISGNILRHFRRFATEKFRDALELILRNEEDPPPSMREVARRLNCDQSHLRKHFPDLCQTISTRYLTYQQEQRLIRLQRMNDQLQQAVQTLDEKKFSISERQVGNLIAKRGIFKEKEARTMLKSFR